MSEPHRPNRLIHEKSPYLLQHAYNPVDWHPWGDEAFALAREADKPIFLSIGYSTCHWCHVMERESFEDPEVARLLNGAFICIKVDREERPDIDNVYMSVCQAMTGSGGWPLTIIMTPEQKPFYAGTYLPRDGRHGVIGMLDLIPQIDNYWRTRRAEVLEIGERVVQALREQESATGLEPERRPNLDPEQLLRRAFEELHHRYDANRGGFGRAPKFAMPHNLMFLLRHWRRSGDPQALEMVEKTLRAMHQGGVWDQIGFGLHRYSTDSHWLVPHFEKMLYDQALLALACLEAHQATGDKYYAQMSREVFAYVLRDMTSQESAGSSAHGFYSAEDADSEGVEGKFYVWTERELRETLPPELAAFIIATYQVTPEGNFTEGPSGGNILHLTHEPDAAAQGKLAQAREVLLTARGKRVRPGRDDKVLADWNGLMIAALARGGAVLNEPAYVEAAAQAADFILTRMVSPEGRLLHRYREGEAAIPAYLDDFAFLTWGLIELYEADFQPRWLREALRLQEYALEHFWDGNAGGFFFSAEDNEQLLVRSKEVYDGAVPSGNSVALLNLLRLARLTGRHELDQRAHDLLTACTAQLAAGPSSHCLTLCGVDYSVGPAAEVVLAGERQALQPMLQALRAQFRPNMVVLVRDDETDQVAPFAAMHTALDGQPTAYVCHQQRCAPPTTDVAEMMALLG